jgi:hypothetical protein
LACFDTQRDRADLLFQNEITAISWDDIFLQQHKRSSNGWVAGKCHLLSGREYAHARRAILARCRKHECGFRQIEFSGDLLHGGFVDCSRVREYREWISRQGFRAENVNDYIPARIWLSH